MRSSPGRAAQAAGPLPVCVCAYPHQSSYPTVPLGHQPLRHQGQPLRHCNQPLRHGRRPPRHQSPRHRRQPSCNGPAPPHYPRLPTRGVGGASHWGWGWGSRLNVDADCSRRADWLEGWHGGSLRACLDDGRGGSVSSSRRLVSLLDTEPGPCLQAPLWCLKRGSRGDAAPHRAPPETPGLPNGYPPPWVPNPLG